MGFWRQKPQILKYWALGPSGPHSDKDLGLNAVLYCHSYLQRNGESARVGGLGVRGRSFN